jgi:hypothetical protein
MKVDMGNLRCALRGLHVSHYSDSSGKSSRNIDFDSTNQRYRFKTHFTSKGGRKGGVEIRASCKEYGNDLIWCDGVGFKYLGQ